jgi:hypothetical protein
VSRRGKYTVASSELLSRSCVSADAGEEPIAI